MSKKIAVIYKTKYGFTKRYAGWITLKLDADLYEVTDIRPKHLLEYETIIFGGGIYRGKINGIKFIIDNYDKIKGKELYIFTVGIEDINEEKRSDLIKNNLNKLENENFRVYNLKGGFEYRELNIVDKIIMKRLKKYIENKNKSDLTQEDINILKGFEEKLDLSNKKSINDMIDDIVYNKNILKNSQYT